MDSCIEMARKKAIAPIAIIAAGETRRTSAIRDVKGMTEIDIAPKMPRDNQPNVYRNVSFCFRLKE